MEKNFLEKMKIMVGGLSHFGASGYIMTEFTEAEILEGIKLNDNEIFVYIYRKCFPQIKAMIHKSFRGLDAEDIFQEALVRAILNVRKDPSIVFLKFCGYLYKICWHICISEKKKQPSNLSMDIADTPDDSDSENEFQLQRMTALKNQMGTPCQEILDLRFGIHKGEDIGMGVYEEGKNMDFKEIADMLNIETANARQRFHRCLENLREMFFNIQVQNINKVKH